MTHRLLAFLRLPVLFCLAFAPSCISHGPESGTEQGDVAYLESSAAARLSYDRGDLRRAEGLYRQALARARATDSVNSIVDAACNLAICRIALKQYESANALLYEAQYDAHRISSDDSEIIFLRAKVAYLQGHLTDAAKLIDEITSSRTDRTVHLGAMILKGQIFCDRSDLGAAKLQLHLAESAAAQGPASASVRADLAKLRGMIARREGHSVDAAHAFDAESELLRLAHRYQDMGRSLVRAADCHLAAGAFGIAADRYYLGARSMVGLGDLNGARPALASSIAAAEKAGDQDALARSVSLLKEISEAVAP